MDKIGRRREYGFTAIEGFADKNVALKSAWLDEYRERVYDQIEDLPVEALDHIIGSSRLSIGALVLHMAWAESYWISQITKNDTPADIARQISPGALGSFNTEPTPSPPADELIAICRGLRDRLTLPSFKKIQDIDAKFQDDGSTYRGILYQLEWHWVYHSGQIGLIRLDWGSDYTWTTKTPMAPKG